MESETDDVMLEMWQPLNYAEFALSSYTQAITEEILFCLKYFLTDIL